MKSHLWGKIIKNGWMEEAKISIKANDTGTLKLFDKCWIRAQNARQYVCMKLSVSQEWFKG